MFVCPSCKKEGVTIIQVKNITEDWRCVACGYIAQKIKFNPEVSYSVGGDNYGEQKKEMVDHPEHYNMHPSGVECIEVVQHMPFNVGTAIKHLWRSDLKHPLPLEDYKKAIRYIQFEIKRVKELNRK